MTHAYTKGANDLINLSQHKQLPTLTVVLVRLAVIWANWRLLARTRKSLRDLDPHLLRDVGLTEHQAHQETRKPFWMH